MPRPRRQKALPPVKVGSINIPRYLLKDGRMMIAYPTADKARKCATFTDHAEGTAEATRIARELHNGGSEAQIFTSADRADFSQAKKDVTPFGIPVHVATAQWRGEQLEIRRAGFSRADVIKAGLEALRRTPHPVPLVVAELLASKNQQSLNGRYARGLSRTLAAFATRHPGEFRELTPAHVESFLAGYDVGPRRRDNILNELRHLFEFGRLRGYLPNEITAAAKVPKIHTRSGSISFFTVAEMRLLLEQVRPDWLPFLAIACFAGIRTEELTRAKDAAKHKDPLRWSDFDWQDREIHVRKETAKTGVARIVPIADNLFEWLSDWRDAGRTGTVAPGSRPDREFGKNARLEKAINQALQDAPRLRNELAVQLEMEIISDAQPELLTSFAWRHNALRHSYGSYRASVIKNMPQLAEEMGNSVQMIQQHYRNPRPKSQAVAWFNIFPPQVAKIVQFPRAVA